MWDIASRIGLLLWPFTLLGLFTIYHWIRAMRKPEIDSSNVFNPIRAWWFSLTRLEQWVGKAPWLAGDEWENINE